MFEWRRSLQQQAVCLSFNFAACVSYLRNTVREKQTAKYVTNTELKKDPLQRAVQRKNSVWMEDNRKLDTGVRNCRRNE